MVDRALVFNYSKAVDALAADAKEKVRPYFEGITAEQLQAHPDEAAAIIDAAVSGNADAAATLSAAFYEQCRLMETGEAVDAIADAGRTAHDARASVDHVMDRIKTPDGGVAADSKVRQYLIEAVDESVRRAANNAVVNSGLHDDREVRYARVPTGDETCEFCIMLASRGWVYRNEEVARHSHANCRCRVVPGFQGETHIDGYDPDALYSRWRESGFQPGRSASAHTRGRSKAQMRADFDEHGGVMEYLKGADSIEELKRRCAFVEERRKAFGDDTWAHLQQSVAMMKSGLPH